MQYYGWLDDWEYFSWNGNSKGKNMLETAGQYSNWKNGLVPGIGSLSGWLGPKVRMYHIIIWIIGD